MKCINCGAEIKSEFKVCPYCGTTIQIVPDYSIYDENDINIILETAETIEKKPEVSKTEITKEQREERARAREKAEELAKQRKMKLTISFIAIGCMLLIIIGVFAKVFIDNSNNNSFAHQMKLADSAMFKGDVDEAEKYYLKALALESDNVEVRLELADLYLEKNDVDKAEKYLKEVIVKDKENYDAYRMLYDIYSDAKDTDAILKLKEGVTSNKILSIFADYSVDTPILSVSSGTYNEDIKLYISAKKGLEIYYNLEGKDPIENGTLYKTALEIKEAGMHTVKVVAKNELGVYSDVVTEIYLIEYDEPEDPDVTPNGGVFTEETMVYIKVPSGCSAYYTWDRTDPTEESDKYVSPIKIPKGRNMLSVIIIDDETGLTSGIYRGMYEYSPEAENEE
ncbi:MAG: chitobiase/beta-hexosaminidase C-terminal domain-containing protein [Agathobacter sp.]|nr:chitobiase/beta-hexosaminidase C-terminal domain-containing protein [Agathobacter sp.]